VNLSWSHASNSVGGVTAVTNGWQVGTIDFQGADGTNFVPAAQIAAVVDGTPGANDMPGRLVFSTTADGAQFLTERMRIDSAGTTTLTSATSTAPFIAKISSTEVARIDSSGRFGIGTSSVSKKLQVNYTDNANHSTSNGTYDVLVWNTADIASYPNCSAGIQLRAGNTSAGAGSIHGIRKGPSNQGELAFAITDNAGNSVEKARFTATGLGIGTTSPANKLTVVGSQQSVVIKNGVDSDYRRCYPLLEMVQQLVVLQH
jgi:hypothetical protein